MMNKNKLLVVDDELLIRDLLYDFFSSKDYQISTANSTEEAIEILEQDSDFDVVLTDLKMPGQDGLALIDHIKGMDTEIPVIIVTAFPSIDTAVEALRKKVFDYIIKPFNINRLSAVVEAASNEKKQNMGRNDE